MCFDKGGYWKANSDEEVSYPSEGNEVYAELEETSFWFKHRNETIIAAIENFPPSSAIFDIGGGNGYVAKGLIDAGFDCVLIEPGIAGASRGLSAEFQMLSVPQLNQPNFVRIQFPASDFSTSSNILRMTCLFSNRFIR